jgi:hypothetical protein
MPSKYMTSETTWIAIVESAGKSLLDDINEKNLIDKRVPKEHAFEVSDIFPNKR